jgi:hypothetical protein
MPVTRKNSWNISLRQKDVTNGTDSKRMSHYMNPPRTCVLPVAFLTFTSLSTIVFFLELHNGIDQNQDCIHTTGKGWKHRVGFVRNPETVCSTPGRKIELLYSSKSTNLPADKAVPYSPVSLFHLRRLAGVFFICFRFLVYIS